MRGLGFPWVWGCSGRGRSRVVVFAGVFTVTQPQTLGFENLLTWHLVMYTWI
jgi:hypothetical protein